jgi:hypothetical protein
MVEEPAPLVVVDDQERPSPGRTSSDRKVDEVQKGLAVPHVGERVIVVRHAKLFSDEPRLDERDVRQVAGGAVEYPTIK